MQYDLRRDRAGWTVFDRWTGQVVEVLERVEQAGLPWEAVRKLMRRLGRRPKDNDQPILQ
jgi:hypothetical protein